MSPNVRWLGWFVTSITWCHAAWAVCLIAFGLSPSCHIRTLPGPALCRFGLDQTDPPPPALPNPNARPRAPTAASAGRWRCRRCPPRPQRWRRACSTPPGRRVRAASRPRARRCLSLSGPASRRRPVSCGGRRSSTARWRRGCRWGGGRVCFAPQQGGSARGPACSGARAWVRARWSRGWQLVASAVRSGFQPFPR
jgi:hypothetical protein